MSLFVDDADFRLYVGDVRDCLRELPAESVHCVVTSPPYWGLRDYGTGAWDGGDPDCDHLGEPFRTKASINANCGTGSDVKNAADRQPMGQTCGRCGATRVDQQIGLEATPDLFVESMVAVFREVRRVLRRDGTCWVNLGDSYTASSNTGGTSSIQGTRKRVGAMNDHSRTVPDGLKPKDLCGIPWRVAFALQADGWYLRSDIVWSKPNPMPESVTDRPTKAHEYVFLLTRSPRYFFDADAIRERHEASSLARANRSWKPSERNEDATPPGESERWRVKELAYNPAGRNIRSVWEIATQPYPEAHFATFPEALPERCIKAGTSERGCCPVCGAPWERVTSPGDLDTSRPQAKQALALARKHNLTDAHFAAIRRIGVADGREYAAAMRASGDWHGVTADPDTWRLAQEAQDVLKGYYREFLYSPKQTTGWRPSCKCAERRDDRRPTPVPCTVLDPFMGSGTTALVARRHGRRSIGVELNPEYAALCARRLQQLSLFGASA